MKRTREDDAARVDETAAGDETVKVLAAEGGNES